MKNEFEQLCEAFGVIKTTRKEMYPRGIHLSQTFLEALKEEFYKHKLEEDTEKPIKNYAEKFNKALRFHIADLHERSDIELEAMRRKFDEQNNQRVPEVSIEGEDTPELPQNDAPKNSLPSKESKPCKQRRIVLQRNIQSIDLPVKESDDPEYKKTSRDKSISCSMPRKSKHGGKVERWGTHQEMKDKKTRGKWVNNRNTK